MKFQRKKLALAMFTGGAFSAFALAPAFAQTTPAQLSAAPIKVEVTGTNIRRVDAETASPVQVITQEDMVRQGFTTLNEVLRDITANNNGLLTQGFSRAFAGGGSGVSLRGLGVGATLVLIDGLRMAGYPLTDDNQRNFVDVSNIPFSSIERVEILLDGASAIYGSDAIGGVVNIILKKNFKGTGLVLDGGSSTKGGGTTYHASVMQGFGAPADKYNGFVALEYRQQDEIKLSQRSGEDWTNFNWTGQGGQDLRPGARPNSVTNPVVQTPYLQRAGASTTPPENNVFLDSRCSLALRNANQCVYEDNWSQILPETQNWNVIGRLSAKLGDNWEAVFTGSYFNSEAQTVVIPRVVPVGSFAGNTVIGAGINPFFSPAIANFTVPASYPGNTLGAPANVRALVPDIPAQTNDFSSGTTRLVATLMGSAWGWDFNGSAGYTKVETDVTYSGYVDNYALVAALQNPINPFRLTGGNSAEVMGRVAPTVSKTATNELSFIQGVGTKDLMKLDGGPLAIAVGVGYTYNKLDAKGPDRVVDGTVSGINAAYAVGNQANTNAYIELVAPVTKTLELDAAIRYDHYDTYGGQFTPKVGFKWAPMKEVAFRGTWGQGFRAPTIAESGESGALFGLDIIRDPLLCPVVDAAGNPVLTAPQNVPLQCAFQVAYLQASGKDLEAEKSDQWGFGVILEPIPKWLTTIDYYSIELKNQIVTAGSLGTFDPFANLVRNAPQQVTFGDGSQGLSAVGPIAYVNSPFLNANKLVTTGIDLGTSYTWQLSNSSTFMAGLQWSHILSYDLTIGDQKYKLAGTHGPTAVSGNTGTPEDRLQLTLQWASGPWTITGTGNYVGKYDLTDPSAGIPDCAEGLVHFNTQRFQGSVAPDQYCNVDAFWYANINIQYKVNKQLMIQFTGTNIFDQKPGVDFASYSGTGLNRSNVQTGAPYNPSLHGQGVVGPFLSLGLTYNF